METECFERTFQPSRQRPSKRRPGAFVCRTLSHSVRICSWYGVIASRVIRMAVQYPLYGEERAFKRSVLLYRFQGVCGARRVKPAGRGLERRNKFLIQPDQAHESQGKKPFHGRPRTRMPERCSNSDSCGSRTETESGPGYMTKAISSPGLTWFLARRQHSDTTRLARFLATAFPYLRTVTKTARVTAPLFTMTCSRIPLTVQRLPRSKTDPISFLVRIRSSFRNRKDGVPRSSGDTGISTSSFRRKCSAWRGPWRGGA